MTPRPGVGLTALCVVVALVAVACSGSSREEIDLADQLPQRGADDVAGPEPVDGEAVASPMPCPRGAEAPALRCLSVSVPLVHGEPGGDRIDLAVAVVDNDDDEVVDSPVVFLNGGPGGGIVHLAAVFVSFPFDVVVVDLRGVGLSEPSLDCPEIDDAFVELMGLPASGEADDDRYGELLAACRERLARAGVEFSAFDTAAAAADIAALRVALGYDEWNLWGSSYGTWVALAVLADHPSGVRSVVLDATLPPDVDFLAEVPANATRAFDELAAACASDDACAARFGEVADLVAGAAERLDEDPVTVRAVRPGTGAPVDVLVDGAAFYAILFDLMYDDAMIGRLPLLVERAGAGDVEEMVQRFVNGRDPDTLEFAEALYDVVVCGDDVPFADPATVAAALEGRDEAFVAAFDTSTFREDCAVWDLGEPAPSADEPVVSDVPTLLVTGRFDPVTPPEWTRRAAETLTRSTVVEMPARGHGLAIGDLCSYEMMLEFLADPAEPLDVSCVASAAAPTFETG